MSRRPQLPPLQEALGYDRDTDPFRDLPPLPLGFSQRRSVRSSSSHGQLPSLPPLPPLPPLSSSASTSYGPPRSASPSRDFGDTQPRHSRSARNIRDDLPPSTYAFPPPQARRTSPSTTFPSDPQSDPQNSADLSYTNRVATPPLQSLGSYRSATNQAYAPLPPLLRTGSSYDPFRRQDEQDAIPSSPVRQRTTSGLASTGISPAIGSLGLDTRGFPDEAPFPRPIRPSYRRAEGSSYGSRSRTPSYDDISGSRSPTSRLAPPNPYQSYEKTPFDDEEGYEEDEEGDWQQGPPLHGSNYERRSSDSSLSSVPLSSGSGSGSGSSQGLSSVPPPSSYPRGSEGGFHSAIPLPPLRSTRSGAFSLESHLPPLPPLRGSSSMLPLSGSIGQFPNSYDPSSYDPSSYDSSYLSNYDTPFAFQKMHPCSVCGKLFVRPSALSTHMNSHTGERPFECTVCGRGFGVASNLRRHMRIHDGRTS